MPQNLITPFEVLVYSPAGLAYPSGQFCELIPQIEEAFFERCLGKEFLDWMVDSIADVPTDAVEFSESETYETGDFVVWAGCIFESLQDANTEKPNEPDFWKPFERFENEGAQMLWTKYLRRLLALTVYRSSLSYEVYRGGGGGVLVNAGDGSGFRGLNKQELVDLKNQLEKDIDLVERNMMRWISDNRDEYDLPQKQSVGCGESGCQTTKRNVRRWNFRN